MLKIEQKYLIMEMNFNYIIVYIENKNKKKINQLLTNDMLYQMKEGRKLN